MTVAASNKSCGDCAMCCKAFEIEAIAKARHTMCGHFKKGVGCGVYEIRPQACRQFVCLWLADEKMDAAWRPDRAKFILWGDKQLMVDVDPAYPDAWKREPYYSKIKLAADPRKSPVAQVVVRNGREVVIVFPEADISLGPEQDRPIESGYRPGPRGREPFAHYVTANN
ncbi:MAG TPA: YkgJ family cysteine cluster protein [Caulobacteraceae bacterium]